LTVTVSQVIFVIAHTTREGEMPVMGPLASANQEIREAERQSLEQQHARLTEPKRLTDRLLDQLEELNLDGVPNVPESYEPMLAGLREQLGAHPQLDRRLIECLQAGTSTGEVIEAIFTIQEVITPPTLPADAYPLEQPAPEEVHLRPV
jgi:hypothetical protein